VQLSHDNDPITHVDPGILFRQPDWLGEPRGRNVPAGQRWFPVVTFVQTLIDAANAMRNTPGEFRSTGHDYRADTARFVAEGCRLPYTEDQLAAVEVQLRRLEKERAARIHGTDDGSRFSAEDDRRAASDSSNATDGAPRSDAASTTASGLSTPATPALNGRTAGPAWIRKAGVGG